jgi:hypothetical protein
VAATIADPGSSADAYIAPGAKFGIMAKIIAIDNATAMTILAGLNLLVFRRFPFCMTLFLTNFYLYDSNGVTAPTISLHPRDD